MKKFVILFALVALASAAPVSDEALERLSEKKDEIVIVQSDQQTHEDGSYNFGYEASDGTAREESADIVNKDTDEEELTITGSYRYIDANGEEVVVNYTAGKNGFVPVGSNIDKKISEVASAAKDLPDWRDARDAELEDGLKSPRN